MSGSDSSYRDRPGREDKIAIAGGENYFQSPASYFAKIIGKSLADVNATLESSYKKTGKYPYSLAELKSTLKAHGIEFNALRDPWDMPYEAVFSADRNQDVLELRSAGPDKVRNTADDFVVTTVRRPNYLVLLLANSVRIKTYSVYPDRPQRVTQAIPVTQHGAYVHVMSSGPSGDGKAPFSVADFGGVLAEQTSRDLMPTSATDRTSLANGTGGIKGQVSDPSGAVVGGV